MFGRVCVQHGLDLFIVYCPRKYNGRMYAFHTQLYFTPVFNSLQPAQKAYEEEIRIMKERVGTGHIGGSWLPNAQQSSKG